MYNDKIYSGKISQNIYFNNKDIYLKLVIFQLFNSYDILYGLKSDFVEDFLRVKILLILNINIHIYIYIYIYMYVNMDVYINANYKLLLLLLSYKLLLLMIIITIIMIMVINNNCIIF